MANYSTMSIKDLKRIAIKVTPDSPICFYSLVNLPHGLIPVSFQVSVMMFIDNMPLTYNVENDIIVAVVDKDEVIFLPYNWQFERILLTHCFEKDTDIYVPNIDADCLHSWHHRRLWRKALKFCK